MRRSPTIRVTRRAAAQIREAEAWWSEHRSSAPGAIAEELERAFALLGVQPHVGARARSTRLHEVRRIHLSRVRFYLYYRVAPHSIDILAFWHSSRGTDPAL